ncbi:hypothetical protein [Paenibacillus sp. 1P07SE]|uniref:hypothetical protein n=1 Tax=Paenibacillus sp. 1P07SE TaxID=3132209 RepID=UPI0039A63903
MKIKKLFVLIIALCMLTFSQAAFATEVSPTAIGIGDTRETAIPLTPCNISGGGACNPTWLPLASSSDVDWFSWTNNTGIDEFVDFTLINPDAYNYAFAYQIRYPNGVLSSKVYAPDGGIGGYNDFYAVYVPAGATLYMEVSPRTTVGSTALYGIYLLV